MKNLGFYMGINKKETGKGINVEDSWLYDEKIKDKKSDYISKR